MTITFNRKLFLVFQMVLKQPKRDKRTDTYKGSISLINVLVLLLFLSKNNNYFINGHKVKINVKRTSPKNKIQKYP